MDLYNLKGFAFPWALRLRMLIDALEGLQYLHRYTPQVLHQDLKCANILVDRNATAKLADQVLRLRPVRFAALAAQGRAARRAG